MADLPATFFLAVFSFGKSGLWTTNSNCRQVDDTHLIVNLLACLLARFGKFRLCYKETSSNCATFFCVYVFSAFLFLVCISMCTNMCIMGTRLCACTDCERKLSLAFNIIAAVWGQDGHFLQGFYYFSIFAGDV